MTNALKTLLLDQGYFNLREVPKVGVCGLAQLTEVVGLFYSMDESGYVGYYTFRDVARAKASLKAWDGYGDPPGAWIKHKGPGDDHTNTGHTKHK